MSFIYWFVTAEIFVSGICAFITMICAWPRMGKSYIFIPIFLMQTGDFIWCTVI